MATDFDPYRILAVERSAGQDEIDQAYRKQWAAYPHGPAPEARLREIQAAYRILSDPEERRAYDERLTERMAETPQRADGQGAWEAEPWAAAPGATAPPGAGEALAGEAPVSWGTREILQAIAVIVGGVILASIPIYLLASLVAGDKNIDDDPYSLAIQFLASLAFQMAALWTAWWFSVRKFHLNWSALGLRRPERGLPWLPFTLAAGGLFIVGVYSAFLSGIGVEPDTDLPDAAYDNIVPLSIIIVLTICIAPFVEEIFFRGFAFKGLARRWGPVWGAIGSGTLFGIAHLGNPGYFYVVPPIIMIGAMFAWSYHYSKSILPSIAAHFMFNLIQIVGTLLTR
jgi:membrane protease YdiL (CAAX protease family)